MYRCSLSRPEGGNPGNGAGQVVDVQFDRGRARALHGAGVVGPPAGCAAVEAGDDRDARSGGPFDQVEVLAGPDAGAGVNQAAAAAVTTARQVRDQDIDLTGPAPALRRGVAKDRRNPASRTPRCGTAASPTRCCSTGTSGTCCATWTRPGAAVGITAANAPEASVTDAIVADLDAAGRYLSELHIDRAYLSSALVRDRGSDLAVFCKAWRVRTPAAGSPGPATLDFAAGQPTCPAGVSMPFEPGKTVRYPKDTCAACPLRARCTTSSHGRSVAIHPDETLLAELRHRQHTPDGRAKLRERVAVEHSLAHIGHWQGRRARYRGTRKNLFDLRRVAVVHNLHVIARQPVTDSYQLAA